MDPRPGSHLRLTIRRQFVAPIFFPHIEGGVGAERDEPTKSGPEKPMPRRNAIGTDGAPACPWWRFQTISPHGSRRETWDQSRRAPHVPIDGSIAISAPTLRLRTMATHEQDYWDSVVTDVRSLLCAEPSFDVVFSGATLGPRSLERAVRAAGLDRVETTAVMHDPRAIAVAHRPLRRGSRRRTEGVWRQAALPLIQGHSS